MFHRRGSALRPLCRGLVYLTHGRRQCTRNFWGLTHDIPAAFYDGSMGIEPVNHVIRRVLRTGYCHHIERLMILGNFSIIALLTSS
jgi:deoxyribodipyrimidine photolyase-related protein